MTSNYCLRWGERGHNEILVRGVLPWRLYAHCISCPSVRRVRRKVARPAQNGPYDQWPDEPLTPESFGRMIEAVSPSSLAAHLDPSRPYDGQPHTDHGERGRTEVRGITFRDLRDCFIRACYEASGLPIERWPGSVHDLPWNDMDIVAVAQNLSCQVEKAMGIFPNVPRLLPADPTEKHWCGPTLERSEWTSHEGDCPSENPPSSGF